MEQVFPDEHWEYRDPEDLGFSKAKLDSITGWLQSHAGDRRYRVVVACVGYLWLNNGKWRGDQVIPQDWLEQAIHVALDILENCPEEEWIYGHGFWTNEYGQMWPDLPRDSYAALGGNSSHIIWVCPSLDLVVVESPSIWSRDDDSEGLRKLIVEACGQ